MIDEWIDKYYAWRHKKIAKKCERRDGLKLEVVLGDHKIKHRYTNPDKARRAWDDSFANGNVFYERYANPWKKTKVVSTPGGAKDDASQRKLIPTKTYRSYMQNKLVSDIVSASTSGGSESLVVMIALLAIAILLGVGTIAMRLFGVI